MSREVAIIGAGPGGLMAAEKLVAAGAKVTVYERKPSPGRKFLLAGRGGLNLTHSEDLERFMTRYGAGADFLRMAIEEFPPAALRAWCEELGQPTFVGSSGRVFPQSFKASPLLRSWLARLDSLGVVFSFQRQWEGWDGEGRLIFAGAEGQVESVKPDATILALGGASWPHLGADGSWVDILQEQKIPVTPLAPANCGFVVSWSEVFRKQCAGQPLKPVTISFSGTEVPGEMVITEKGVEGGVIYALSAMIRDNITKNGSAIIKLDLRPGVSLAELTTRFSQRKMTLSLSNALKGVAGLSAVSAALVREVGGAEVKNLAPAELASLIKGCPLRLDAPFDIDRAISTAGGIALDAVDDKFMLKSMPGVFVVGEMLDWEAPTGGYLLQAVLSSAVRAAKGVAAYIS